MTHRARPGGPAGSYSWWGSLIHNKRDLTGQLYMRNRYYDPQAGRFTQEDPIGLAGGINLYGFAAGDPVSYDDPYGLSAQGGCPPLCNELNPRHLDIELERAEWARDNPRSALALGVVTVVGAAVALAAPEVGAALLTRLGSAAPRAAPAATAAAGVATQASRLPNTPQFHAIVSRSGELLRTTADITLPHLEFVRRTVGTLPDGATVVTAFRVRDGIQAITSRSVHGVQMPAPRHVIDALNAALRASP